MTTYIVHMDTTEQAAFLADRQGNHFHLAANDVTVTFDESAHTWFASRPADDDGHIDADGVLWFGGDPYPVTANDA